MKTSSIKRSIISLLLVLSFPLVNAQASEGVIHFRGAIVESPCNFAPQQQSTELTCSENGKRVVRTVALNKLNNYTPQSDVPLSTKIHYLNAQRNLAVLEVTYR